jgi:hypothetical protein
MANTTGTEDEVSMVRLADGVEDVVRALPAGPRPPG